MEKEAIVDYPESYGSVSAARPTGADGEKQAAVSLSFHDVSYAVTSGVFKKTTKVILNNLTGVMRPGLNAIMGPTGSGKTSLLDVLADRKSKGGLTGIVLVNGRPQPKYFKCMSGYVVQDDVIMGTLSVRENLYFSAALRLPNSMKWAEKKRRVEKVIGELGLTGCADTKVMKRERRDRERKRLKISK
ncbi:PREDICTED: ATP-binding cassette sub-family G member 2-like [Amphimedon queenslandica]|uniref:ABC transporter domain-containing protein n=2 Tax=Amphimedon queenslandica TaxID=400682 RepID=A0AAN0JNW2_AMPQE|nr:PREDICTED: ATP-binding cassette sub-family G member 2-like [Amphimedon queenslandica]|eukprot:XP_019858513.1 PREDICTED: ATP-binding cassette sub-family G member 2-like [Amphimedon queenslandica]